MRLSYRKKGRTIQSEAREVVRRILQACDFENSIGNIRFPLIEPTKRAAFYTGLSECTIRRIRKECHPDQKKSPSSGEEKTDQTDDTEPPLSDVCAIQVVRNTLMDFYLVKKEVPTWSQLLDAIMKKKKDIQWGVQTFKRLLKDIGYKWKKFENKRKILLERPEISLWRLEYLKAIKKAREENKNIIYVSDTWVDNKLNMGNCWISGEWSVLQTSRFIILEAGNENGFIENVQHITKVGQTTNYRDLLNYENFKKWVTEKLLPNIPRNSVIVLDGEESYHMAEQNKVPSKYATRKEMLDWLEKNDVPFSPNMCKVELMDLINRFKGNEKVYCVDELLKVKGHTVLRLPPYMCELNPLHAAWVRLDSILRVKKKTEAATLTLTSFNKLKAIIVDAIASITDTDWKGFWAQVQQREEDYWVMDGKLDVEMEGIIADVENGETLPSANDSGSECSESFSDEEEWPPFELVECGEEPTMGYEQPQPDRRPSILETILEKPKPPNRSNANRTTPAEKKRKRKDDKVALPNGDTTTDAAQNTSTNTLSSVDAKKLKKAMQEVLNNKVRLDQQNDGSGASCSSSDQFAEVLIKEEMTLVDVPAALKNVFGEEEELPVIEIKQEQLSFLDECNPLGTNNMD